MSSLIEIAQRLERVESALAIQRLSADYCRGADRRDLDVLLSVWTPAGVWKVRDDLDFTGREQIAAAIGEQWRGFSCAFHRTLNASDRSSFRQEPEFVKFVSDGDHFLAADLGLQTRTLRNPASWTLNSKHEKPG